MDSRLLFQLRENTQSLKQSISQRNKMCIRARVGGGVNTKPGGGGCLLFVLVVGCCFLLNSVCEK